MELLLFPRHVVEVGIGSTEIADGQELIGVGVLTVAHHHDDLQRFRLGVGRRNVPHKVTDDHLGSFALGHDLIGVDLGRGQCGLDRSELGIQQGSAPFHPHVARRVALGVEGIDLCVQPRLADCIGHDFGALVRVAGAPSVIQPVGAEPTVIHRRIDHLRLLDGGVD